jgi:hypothetical protein
MLKDVGQGYSHQKARLGQEDLLPRWCTHVAYGNMAIDRRSQWLAWYSCSIIFMEWQLAFPQSKWSKWEGIKSFMTYPRKLYAIVSAYLRITQTCPIQCGRGLPRAWISDLGDSYERASTSANSSEMYMIFKTFCIFQ